MGFYSFLHWPLYSSGMNNFHHHLNRNDFDLELLNFCQFANNVAKEQILFQL